jgi:hypothetical protein
MMDSDDHLAFFRMVDRLEQFHPEAQMGIWKRFQQLSDKRQQQNDAVFHDACKKHARNVFLTGFFNGLSFGFGTSDKTPSLPSYPVTGFKHMEPLLNQAIREHCDGHYNKYSPAL